MISRKSINISGHYVVSINPMPFHILCTLKSKIERSGRSVFYIVLKTQRPSDTVSYFRVMSNPSQRL